MKKFLPILITILLVALTAIPALAADGSYNKFGSKAYGMGGAFTAIADDASAIYWNPAGLTQSSLVGLQASGGVRLDLDELGNIRDFITKINDLQGSDDPVYVFDELSKLETPGDVDINGNGIAAVNLRRIGIGTIINNEFSFRGEEVEKTLAGETKKLPKGEAANRFIGQGIAGFGMNLVDPPVVGSLSIGGSGKLLYSKKDTASFDPTDLTTDSSSVEDALTYNEGEMKQGFGADLGALATLTDTDVFNVKAGATVKNVFSTLDVEHPGLERTITLGTGATFKFPLVEILSARVAADLEKPEDGDMIKRLGAEGTLGVFSLRLGTYGTDLADKDKRTVTGGLGLNLPFIDFNIAADSDKYVNFSGTFNF